MTFFLLLSFERPVCHPAMTGAILKLLNGVQSLQARLLEENDNKQKAVSRVII
jgi:hypothetical protein